VKTMLMVAAGVVVGFTMVIAVAIAVLIQVLERLLPLVLVAVLVVIVLRLVRRRPGQQAIHHHAYQAFPVTPAPVAVPPAPAPLPVAANDHAATYLHWGPPRCEDLDALVAITGASHGRRP
jgi:hypothetical protein